MIKRGITGIVFLGIMVNGIIWDSVVQICLFALIIFLGIWEFMSLFLSKKEVFKKLSYTITGLICFILPFLLEEFQTLSLKGLIIIPLLVMILFIAELFNKKPKPQNMAMGLLGIVYLTLPLLLISLAARHFTDYNYLYVLSPLIFIWSSDTFAYLGGRSFGKTKLFERISPKKTFEGAISGILAALIASTLIWHFSGKQSLLWWLGLAFITAITGIIGDLLQSMLKRHYNLKDSGNILPGHGGILDRFDAFLGASVFAASYIILV